MHCTASQPCPTHALCCTSLSWIVLQCTGTAPAVLVMHCTGTYHSTLHWNVYMYTYALTWTYAYALHVLHCNYALCCSEREHADCTALFWTSTCMCCTAHATLQCCSAHAAVQWIAFIALHWLCCIVLVLNSIIVYCTILHCTLLLAVIMLHCPYCTACTALHMQHCKFCSAHAAV